ncbi:hypothetical protein ACLOJK_023753 [Asimina triloba]
MSNFEVAIGAKRGLESVLEEARVAKEATFESRVMEAFEDEAERLRERVSKLEIEFQRILESKVVGELKGQAEGRYQVVLETQS